MGWKKTEKEIYEAYAWKHDITNTRLVIEKMGDGDYYVKVQEHNESLGPFPVYGKNTKLINVNSTKTKALDFVKRWMKENQ